MRELLKDLKKKFNLYGGRGKKDFCEWVQRSYFMPCVCSFWKEIK